jgi:pimeloyl-ACP methyl ester carboxylesterase
MRETTITSADGTRLAARHSGRGSPIVLVHGALGSIDTFLLVEGLLAERHSVWVYSRRGRGGSGDGPRYSLDREVEDVSAVLAAAGDHAHLLGHSGGAIYCLLAATHHASLRSLVLYEPPLHGDRFAPALVDRVQAAVDAGDPDRALELFYAAAGVVEEEVRIIRAIPEVLARAREGVRLAARELRTAQEARHRLRAAYSAAVPTLYLYGEATKAPIFAIPDEVARLLPHAELHGLRGQRHLAWAFDPTTFAEAVLEFTSAVDGVGAPGLNR